MKDLTYAQLGLFSLKAVHDAALRTFENVPNRSGFCHTFFICGNIMKIEVV